MSLMNCTFQNNISPVHFFHGFNTPFSLQFDIAITSFSKLMKINDPNSTKEEIFTSGFLQEFVSLFIVKYSRSTAFRYVWTFKVNTFLISYMINFTDVKFDILVCFFLNNWQVCIIKSLLKIMKQQRLRRILVV